MKNSIEKYKIKLEKEIICYFDLPITERNIYITKNLIECWIFLNDITHILNKENNNTLSDKDIKLWNDNMVNDDGSVGGHWLVEQTNELAKLCGVEFTHISPIDFNVTANMMYSDYHNVAMKYGVDITNFYGDLAKAFLFDKDAPTSKEKLSAYYHNIVKK